MGAKLPLNQYFLILFHIWIPLCATSKSTGDPVSNLDPARVVFQFSFLGFWLRQLNFSVFTSLFQGGLQRKSLASRRAAALFTPCVHPTCNPNRESNNWKWSWGWKITVPIERGNKDSLAEGAEMEVKRQRRMKERPSRCKHFQSPLCLIFHHSCSRVLFAHNRQIMSRRNPVAPTQLSYVQYIVTLPIN